MRVLVLFTLLTLSTTLRLRVSQGVPRHECRRALRNLEELLARVSKHLHEVSGGVKQVEQVEVELPASWRGTECSQGVEVGEGGVGREEVLVAPPHPLLGNHPHVLQTGGCGEKGEHLSLPFPLLTSSPTMGEEEVQEVLMATTRWYFGVFPEVGTEGDTMYPTSTTEGLTTSRNIGCSDASLALGRGLCSLSEEYDSGAATKQNLLCSGVSARQTILSMVEGMETREWQKPSLTYMMPLDTQRVVLVLDMTTAMEEVWEAVLAATFHYIHSLREGTELAIVSFRDRATVHLGATRVEGGNREGLHYRIPRRLPQGESSACLTCAMETAMSLATNTSTILLLSSSLALSDKNRSKLMEHEGSAKAILQSVLLGPPTLVPRDEQVYLVDTTQTLLNISSQLTLTLASLTEDAPSHKFHQEELPMRDIEGSFSVEASLASNLWLQVLTQDTTDISVFEVRSPSGQLFSFPKYDAGLVYFSLRGPRETGVWSYTVRFYSGPRATSTFLLECWGSGSLAPVQLSAWTSAPSLPNTPVLLYARLEAGGVPVNGAMVEAEVHRPGLPPVTLHLEDSGTGYPDITRGDGVYSGYFTQFAAGPGLYSVTIKATNNSSASIINTKKVAVSSSCCGSSLPMEPSVPLEAFTRFTTAPSFPVTWGSEFYLLPGSVQRRDVFPPNRITDFRLANMSSNSLFVTLSWTAPGDDFTLGKAFRYEIRCFTSKEALSQENFGEQGIPVHSSLVPVPEEQGSQQRCTVGVPWANEIFYYAIVAFDAAGNRGEVSNMMAVYVKEPTTTPTPMEDISTYLNMEEVSRSLPLQSFLHSESMVYVIAGVISIILILIVIIIVVIARHIGGFSMKVAPVVPPAPGSPPPSLPDLCHPGLEESYTNHSLSYVSGYDLPELLDYSMVRGKAPLARHILEPPSFPQYHLPSGRPGRPGSSPSPVNSTYTGGQSTDCSVSVSGSDHELVAGDSGLQVVTVTEARASGSQAAGLDLRATSSALRPPPPEYRARPQAKKTPPAVPNKTVHASLV